MIVLGIETSCDETAAVVTGDRRILAERILSQLDEHRPFGGVVPEVAGRALEVSPKHNGGLLDQVAASRTAGTKLFA